jgi:hypothetical protein
MINSNPVSEIDNLLTQTGERQRALLERNNKFFDLTNDVNQRLLDVLTPIDFPKQTILQIIKESDVALTESEQQEIIDNLKYKKEFSSPELKTKLIHIICPRRAELAKANAIARRALEEVKWAMYQLEIAETLSGEVNSVTSLSKIPRKNDIADGAPATSSSKLSLKERLLLKYMSTMQCYDTAMDQLEASEHIDGRKIAGVKALQETATQLLNSVLQLK